MASITIAEMVEGNRYRVAHRNIGRPPTFYEGRFTGTKAVAFMGRQMTEVRFEEVTRVEGGVVISVGTMAMSSRAVENIEAI